DQSAASGVSADRAASARTASIRSAHAREPARTKTLIGMGFEFPAPLFYRLVRLQVRSQAVYAASSSVPDARLKTAWVASSSLAMNLKPLSSRNRIPTTSPARLLPSTKGWLRTRP